jgi:hypothetical protein
MSPKRYCELSIYVQSWCDGRYTLCFRNGEFKFFIFWIFTIINYVFIYLKLQSCSSGQCVNDPNAPTGNCIYGDDIVLSSDLNNLVSFPGQFATCPTAVSVLSQNGLDPVYWCNSSMFTFSQKCCKTCQCE